MEHEHFGKDYSDEPRGRSGGLARKLAVILVLLLLGGFALPLDRELPTVIGMFRIARALADDPSRQAPDIWPQIGGSIGGTQQDQTAGPPPDIAAVSQRVVLYEGQEPKQYVGWLLWKMVTASPEPGQPADVAIRAEVEIPQRFLRMNFTLRRNLDPSLPASHTIEIEFNTPADFPPGGIADVPVVAMEDTDKTLGAALTGRRVKVSADFFFIGLSSREADMKRNVQLLKDRRWLQIPIVYNNGQRVLLAIEKGVPGDRVFDDAWRAWGETPAAAR
jgi:hypothetical protein